MNEGKRKTVLAIVAHPEDIDAYDQIPHLYYLDPMKGIDILVNGTPWHG